MIARGSLALGLLAVLFSCSGRETALAQEPPPGRRTPAGSSSDAGVAASMKRTAQRVGPKIARDPSALPPQVAPGEPLSLVLVRLRPGKEPVVERVLRARPGALAAKRARQRRDRTVPKYFVMLTDRTGESELSWAALPPAPRLRVESSPEPGGAGIRPRFGELREVVVPVYMPFREGARFGVFTIQGNWATQSILTFGDQPTTYELVPRPNP